MFRNIFFIRNLSVDQFFLFHHGIDFFLSFMNLFADFFKFFKCRLFIKNSRKSTENGYEHWDITGTNKWIRLLFFDDKSWLLFSQPVYKQLIIFCYIYRRCHWIVYIKPILKIILPNGQSMRILKMTFALLLN